MKIVDIIERIFKRRVNKKPDLRQLCIDKYGEEFGEIYDASCRGESIGTLTETLVFLNMIEKVRKENNLKNRE